VHGNLNIFGNFISRPLIWIFYYAWKNRKTLSNRLITRRLSNFGLKKHAIERVIVFELKFIINVLLLSFNAKKAFKIFLIARNFLILLGKICMAEPYAWLGKMKKTLPLTLGCQSALYQRLLDSLLFGAGLKIVILSAIHTANHYP